MLPLKGHDSEESDVSWPFKIHFPNENCNSNSLSCIISFIGLHCTLVMVDILFYPCKAQLLIICCNYILLIMLNIYYVSNRILRAKLQFQCNIKNVCQLQKKYEYCKHLLKCLFIPCLYLGTIVY